MSKPLNRECKLMKKLTKIKSDQELIDPYPMRLSQPADRIVVTFFFPRSSEAMSTTLGHFARSTGSLINAAVSAHARGLARLVPSSPPDVESTMCARSGASRCHVLHRLFNPLGPPGPRDEYFQGFPPCSTPATHILERAVEGTLTDSSSMDGRNSAIALSS